MHTLVLLSWDIVMLFSNEWLTCSHNGRKDTNTTRNRTIVLPLPPPPVTSRAPGIMPFVYVRWHYERNSHVLVFVDRDDLHCLLILLCTAHVWPVRFDLLFDYLQGIPDALNKLLLRKGNRHWCFNNSRLSLWFFFLEIVIFWVICVWTYNFIT